MLKRGLLQQMSSHAGKTYLAFGILKREQGGEIVRISRVDLADTLGVHAGIVRNVIGELITLGLIEIAGKIGFRMLVPPRPWRVQNQVVAATLSEGDSAKREVVDFAGNFDDPKGGPPASPLPKALLRKEKTAREAKLTPTPSPSLGLATPTPSLGEAFPSPTASPGLGVPVPFPGGTPSLGEGEDSRARAGAGGRARVDDSAATIRLKNIALLNFAVRALGLRTTSQTAYGQQCMRAISKRLREGYSHEDLYKAIKQAAALRKGGDKFNSYVNPLYIWGMGLPALLSTLDVGSPFMHRKGEERAEWQRGIEANFKAQTPERLLKEMGLSDAEVETKLRPTRGAHAPPSNKAGGEGSKA